MIKSWARYDDDGMNGHQTYLDEKQMKNEWHKMMINK